jgi:hypothetical protein
MFSASLRLRHADSVVEQLRAFEAAGCDHFMIKIVPEINDGDLATFSQECLPHLR